MACIRDTTAWLELVVSDGDCVFLQVAAILRPDKIPNVGDLRIKLMKAYNEVNMSDNTAFQSNWKSYYKRLGACVAAGDALFKHDMLQVTFSHGGHLMRLPKNVGKM